jgi:hypothetical protein
MDVPVAGRVNDTRESELAMNPLPTESPAPIMRMGIVAVASLLRAYLPRRARAGALLAACTGRASDPPG